MPFNYSSEFQAALEKEIVVVQRHLDKLIQMKAMVDEDTNSMSSENMAVAKRRIDRELHNKGTKRMPPWKDAVREAVQRAGRDLTVKEIMHEIMDAGYDVSGKTRPVFYNSVYTVLKRSGEFQAMPENKWRIAES